MGKYKYMTKADQAAFILLGQAAMPFRNTNNDLSLFGPNALLPESNIYSSLASLETMEELLKRDDQREKDGFPKRIKIGRIPTDKGKIIVVPVVEEEKLVHANFEPAEDGTGRTSGGQGEEQEGDILGEIPLDECEGCDGCDESGAGSESGGEHDVGTDAYKIGQELMEKFELPNLRKKRKTISTDKINYDLTDRHRGSGQVLDKRATLQEIVKTNNGLGRLDKDNPDTTNLVVSPRDKIYRVLSRERVEESQAVVFFLRDYSGSMMGKPAEVVVAQHLMIYSWLLVQYKKLVIPRFILHDTEAKEAPNFDVYYRSQIGGGTRVKSAFRLTGEIIESENLSKDYNIYIFYGTDGDDYWDDGEETIAEIERLISLEVNRIGIFVARNRWHPSAEDETTVEKYIQHSSLLKEREFLRMFAASADDVTEEVNIEAIKELVSE